MGQPAYLCGHSEEYRFRISSHLDLVTASRKGVATFSCFTCGRRPCMKHAETLAKKASGRAFVTRLRRVGVGGSLSAQPETADPHAADFVSNPRVHVYPEQDVIFHELSADCICSPVPTPRSMLGGEVEIVMTHHSLDGCDDHPLRTRHEASR